jgi:cell division septation protein DedD
MEQSENQQPKNSQVKEKSVYLLHLDGPRILILSAITIGLLTVAFLIGMKITGDTGKESLAVQNDALVDQNIAPQGQDAADSSKSSMPDLPTGNNALPQIGNNTTTLPDLPLTKNNDLPKVHDAVTADDNHIVIPPAKEVAKTEKIASKTTKKKTDKKDSVKKKKEVVEVSSETVPKADKHFKSGYVLQVASYDKMDIAKKEVSALKDMNYDAFVDRSAVKGKNFFRVRIGPISSKDKAIQMLNDIQNNERYAESYVVKE